MIKEITVDTLITYESQPDGGKTPIIDPYDGCTINCPYCFQKQEDPEWNTDLLVKTNIDTLISEQLSNRTGNELLFIGSRCDPYMPIEKTYTLTNKCIKQLSRLKIPVMIVSKGDISLIRRDIPLFKTYPADFTFLLGFSNINDYISDISINDSPRIALARDLCKEGITVWAFITPVLPGITPVDEIIAELPDTVPVYLDKLRVFDTNKAQMFSTITRFFPRLRELYHHIIFNDDERYYRELQEQYGTNERISFLFQ